MLRPPITSPGRAVGRVLAIPAASLTLLLTPSCAPSPVARPGLGPPARARPDPFALRRAFAEAADLFLAGDFIRARDRFRRVARAGGDSPEAARAWHSLGRCELALGRAGTARDAFSRALARAAGDASGLADLRAYALAGLADAALASGRPAEALDHLARVADEGLAGRLAADELLFRRASALDALGRREAAAREYLALAGAWPASALAAEALARAETLRPPAGAPRGGGPGAPSPDARPAPGCYEVRAGTFGDRDSAEAEADALRDRGFRPRIAGARVERGRAFVVSIGRFAAREAAEALAREAERAGFPARVAP